jgi:SPP1 gp7 family putative phage head morphogenesis protein
MKVFKNILGFDIGIKKSNPNALDQQHKTTKKNPKITEIVKGFQDRSRKDINSWRTALTLMKAPENPRFDKYYDLVEDLLTDGHLQSQIQMRKMSTLNSSFHVVNRKTEVPNQELSFILQQQWFYQLLDQLTDKIIYGTTLIEFLEFDKENIKHQLIPRRNVVSIENKIIPDLQKPGFINYDDEFFKPWLLQIGKAGDIGIINNIIPNLIWARNVAQSWAEFCERFGLPLITAVTNTTDSSVLNDVHETLVALGEASAGTFPSGTEIKFHEANRTDAYATYQNFIKMNQDVISKQLVGSTMLSDQGTSRSQTEVHERSLDEKISKADKRDISFFVNDQLFPLLTLQGYSISEDDVFKFIPAKEKVNLEQLWKITIGLLDKGYEIPQTWLSSSFNIPIDGKKKRPMTSPVNISEANLRYDLGCCSDDKIPQSLDTNNTLKKLCEDLLSALYKNESTAAIKGQIIVSEALSLLKGLRKGLKPSNNYTAADTLMLQLMEYNCFEFSYTKTEARLASMSSLLIDKKTKKLRDFNSFKKLVLKEVELLNKNYLLTEYNLAVSVGQNSANYIRFLKEKDSVTSLVKYQTAGDDKVRSAHTILDGKIFDLNDTQAMDLLPPNGFGCRCEFVQYLGNDKKVTKGTRAKELLRESDPKYNGSNFEINRANLNQVFTKKEFYSDTKKLPSELNKMTFEGYGLQSYTSMKSTLKEIYIDNTITKKNAKELFVTDGTITRNKKKLDFMGFVDYLKRPMILTQTSFNKHLNNNKTGMFPLISKVLKAPDETWYYKSSKGSFKSRYIKFYKQGILCIDCSLDNKQVLQIDSWDLVKKADKDIRKGLLINKK